MRFDACIRRASLKSGVYTAATVALLAICLQVLSRAGWWYQGTIWFRALLYLNYPAGELTVLVLRKLEVPRLYDVPLTWRETVITNLTGWSFGIVWWFFLGAAAALVWLRLKGSARG